MKIREILDSYGDFVVRASELTRNAAAATVTARQTGRPEHHAAARAHHEAAYAHHQARVFAEHTNTKEQHSRSVENHLTQARQHETHFSGHEGAGWDESKHPRDEQGKFS